MTTKAKKFIDEALLLPREDRAELIDKLLESLNLSNQKEIDTLWKEEAERRIKEYEEGKIKAVEAKKVFEKIKSKYNW